MNTARDGLDSDSGSLERFIPVPGTRNVRDIGGYPVVGGGVTRWRTLVRADSLEEVDEEGWRVLRETGVRAVYDIRDRAEYRRKPTTGMPPEIRIVNLPMLRDEVDRATVRDLPHLYRVILDICGPSLVDLLEEIVAGEESLPGLLHCSAGKDRTGVAVAVVLSAIGVEDRYVIEDYALTARTLTPSFLDVMRERSVRMGWPPESTEDMLGSPPEAMGATLDHLDRAYGGARAYLRKHGMSETALNELRASLVDPPS